MDIFSHALWGVTIVRKQNLFWWVALTGMAPDILGTGPGFIYIMIKYHVFISYKTWNLLPYWMNVSYSFWHGLPAVVLIWLLFYLFARGYQVIIWPYAWHIFIDLFSHHNNILARLLFPLPNPWPQLNWFGYDWWQYSTVWIINLVLLVIVNLYFWWPKVLSKLSRD